MPIASPRRCVGIDVAKRHWDAAVHGQPQRRRFLADEAGLAELFAWIGEDVLVCVEATGGYEAWLVESLQARGVPVAVVNPRQVRDFARATGQLAKTDAIDAAVLARFAATLDPEPTEPTGENQRRLKSLRARRQQLVEMITQEKNRLGTARDPAIRASIQQALDFLGEQLAEIDRQLAQLTCEDPAFRRRRELLVSVPGVADTTAVTLIAELPELGALNRAQVARLVGVAPVNRDSGTFRGRRTTGGGRRAVRRGLYMATLVATRHNPVIRRHYQQLLERGKAKMLALVACMRKLLIILNTLVKNQTPWKNPITS